MMRRSPFAMFLLIGFGLLLGAAIFGGVESVGAVLAAPFIALGFLLKVMLFVFLFGMFAKFVGRSGRSRWEHRTEHSDEHWGDWKKHWESHGSDWRSQRRPRKQASAESPPQSETDRFDEWHRLAHAREEVDDHVPPVET